MMKIRGFSCVFDHSLKYKTSIMPHRHSTAVDLRTCYRFAADKFNIYDLRYTVALDLGE